MIKKYVVFVIGGGIGTLLYLFIVYFLVEAVGLWYLWAYCVGSAFSITFNFIYHRSITFNVREKARDKFIKFALSSILIGFITIGLVYVLTDELGIMYMLSGIIAVGLMSVINFLINRFWIFQKENADQTNMKSHNAKCLVCRNGSAAFFIRKNGWDLYKCQKCGLIFVFPVPTEHQELCEKECPPDLKDEINGENENAVWEATEETFSRYLEILEKFHPKKGKLFDVGAATGVFIELAQEKGWDASGMELLSHQAVAGEKQRQVRIVEGNFEKYQEEEESFDAMTFWDVLEHFAHPEKAVKNAERMLKSGGILAINTPDASSFPARLMGKHWHLLVPPSHLNCFNRINIKIFLERYGFEIIYASRVGKKFSLRNIFKVLAIWQKLRTWENIYKYLLRSRLGGLKVSINTRDNQFLIARKRG